MQILENILNNILLAYDNNDLKTVKELCRSILDKEPENEKILYILGLTYFKENDYLQALKYIQKLEEINKSFETYVTLAEIYSALQNIDEAIRAYEKTVRIDYTFVDGYYNLGVLYSLKEEQNKAIYYYQEAIKADNKYAKAIEALAEIYFKSRKYEESFVYFSAAAKLNPDNMTYTYRMGDIYFNLGGYNEAVSYYKKTLNSVPDNPELLLRIAKCHLAKNENDAALSYLNKLKQLNCDDIDVNFQTGNALFQNEEYEKAIDYYKKVLKINPCAENAHHHMAMASVFLRDIYSAVLNYQKVLELTPENHKVRYSLGCTLFTDQKVDECWELFKSRNRIYDSQKAAGKDIFAKDWCYKPEGKTIYVKQVSGFGDAIQFIRYLPLLKEKGANVITKVRPPLVEFFRANGYGEWLLDESAQEDNLEYDAWLVSLCLPCYFKNNFDTTPFRDGYLKADPEKPRIFGRNILTIISTKSA